MVLTMEEKRAVTLDLYTIFSRVVYAYDMYRIKENTIVPPYLQFDNDPYALNESDENADHYKFEFGRYDNPIIHLTKSHVITKLGGYITIFPERLKRATDMELSNCPLEFMYGKIVHTMLHEYMHHVRNTKMYLKYRNELKVNGPKLEARYREYDSYLNEIANDGVAEERLNELKTMYFFSKSLRYIFEIDMGISIESYPNYQAILNLVILYFDRANADAGVYNGPTIRRLHRRAPNLTMKKILDKFEEYGKTENINIELAYV